MLKFIKSIFKDPNEKELEKLQPIVNDINNLEPEIKKLSNSELKTKTEEFKDRYKKGETLDELLPEAFAVVREAAQRSTNEQFRHFDVQLMGGIVLHQGQIAEMKTGEGKTLVATLPLYLNALSGRGAQLITVNDYLSQVGAGWMAPVYHFLGLSTGVIIHGQALVYDPEYYDENQYDERMRNFRPVERKEAYQCDIVYGTNNEFGFDYLRDNMVYSKEQKKQPSFDYVIIDEIDSILIDEARTPLIISQPEKEDPKNYRRFASLASQLQENKHYNVDRKKRQVDLTADGITKVEKKLDIDNLYHPEKATSLHKVTQALKAKELFIRDEDYITKEGEVVIVDQFTGR